MNLYATPLTGLWVIETETRGDERGRFTRLFCSEQFAAIRPELRFVQSNLSYTSKRGTVRGMHFQRPPAQEAKLVRCLRGRVFDVTVDLRLGSPTFGRWHSVELSSDNERQIFIPEGCAHGFQALSDDVELLYQHTAAYASDYEDGVRYDDPTLAIAWPLPVTVLSERDRQHPLITPQFSGVQA